MSLEYWYRKKHRWDVPMGEVVENFSLGMESQRWQIILQWKSVIAYAQLQHQGANRKEIAQAVGRCPSTISRELRRNRTDGEYYAAQAQREAERRRQERPLVRKMEDPTL